MKIVDSYSLRMCVNLNVTLTHQERNSSCVFCMGSSGNAVLQCQITELQ
jgi:hypothetical protein